MSRLAAIGSLAVLLSGALQLAGCDDCEGPSGHWSDVRTAHGTHDGYEVLSDCPPNDMTIYVRGTGARWLDDVGPGDTRRVYTLDKLATDLIGPMVPNDRQEARIEIFDSHCTKRPTVQVILSDWRWVDRVITKVGALFKQRDLREEVAIEVVKLCPPAYGY